MKFPYKMSRRLFTSATIAVGLIAGAGVSAAEKIKVAAIYTLPVEQQWISRIHKALNTAAESGAIEYTYSENVANTDYERVMREYAEQGQNLIVGEVFGLERAARKVAKDYTDTAFLMGSSFGPVAPNFSVFDNWIHEPSYLTGMVAGSMTKSNVIGMVGGYAIPEVNRLMHAFMDGARDVNPDVKFLVNFGAAPIAVQTVAFIQGNTGELTVLFWLLALLGLVAVTLIPEGRVSVTSMFVASS